MRSGVDQSRLDEIIGSIYDASMDDADWTQVAKSIFRVLGAHAGQLWTPSFLRRGQPGIDVGEIANDPKIRADYTTYYHQRDIWYQRTLERGLIADGSVITDGMLVTEKEFRRSEFWAHFTRPVDCFRMCTGILVDGLGDIPLVSLTLFRGPRAPEFGRTEQRSVKRLLPHLRRALVLRNKIVSATASPGERALEMLAIPLMVLARDGAVLLANPAAERMTAGNPNLCLRERRLRLSDGEAQRRLEELLRHAADDFTQLPAAAPAVLRCGDPSNEGLVLNIVPLRRSERIADSRAVALLVLRSPCQRGISEPELRSIYALTAAEAALAALLAAGETLETVSLARGVSMNTVRTQLKQLLQKTGTSRQADLVRLLLCRHMPLV